MGNDLSDAQERAYVPLEASGSSEEVRCLAQKGRGMFDFKAIQDIDDGTLLANVKKKPLRDLQRVQSALISCTIAGE